MSAKEVDEYLRGLDEPKRSTLDHPLPKALVKKLIQVRLADIARRTR